jgi:hypothetical protein
MKIRKLRTKKFYNRELYKFYNIGSVGKREKVELKTSALKSLFESVFLDQLEHSLPKLAPSLKENDSDRRTALICFECPRFLEAIIIKRSLLSLNLRGIMEQAPFINCHLM